MCRIPMSCRSGKWSSETDCLRPEYCRPPWSDYVQMGSLVLHDSRLWKLAYSMVCWRKSGLRNRISKDLDTGVRGGRRSQWMLFGQVILWFYSKINNWYDMIHSYIFVFDNSFWSTVSGKMYLIWFQNNSGTRWSIPKTYRNLKWWILWNFKIQNQFINDEGLILIWHLSNQTTVVWELSNLLKFSSNDKLSEPTTLLHSIFY